MIPVDILTSAGELSLWFLAKTLPGLIKTVLIMIAAGFYCKRKIEARVRTVNMGVQKKAEVKLNQESVRR